MNADTLLFNIVKALQVRAGALRKNLTDDLTAKALDEVASVIDSILDSYGE